MKIHKPIMVLLASSTLIQCGGPLGPINELPRQLSQSEMRVVEANTEFALNLLREINAQDTTGDNIFISPLSISMALGMALNGAAANTFDEMEHMLGFGGMSESQVNESYRDLIDLLLNLDPQVKMNLANAVWYREDFPVLSTFLDVNRDYFNARTEGLNFQDPATVDYINDWVNTETNGKIPTLLQSIPANVVMYLMNAVYFKGNWTYQFDKSLTRDEPFFLESGTLVQTQMMMHRHQAPYFHTSNSTAEIADLPYGGGAFRMTIVLPHDGTSIDSLLSVLDGTTWNNWMADLDSVETQVTIPKFTFEYEQSLKTTLQALGMVDAFDDAADFSRIVSGGGIKVSEVKHKTFVEVNEEGTEAAAVTSVVFTDSAVSMFLANRPFVFAIREKFSGTVLFIGTMLNPTL